MDAALRAAGLASGAAPPLVTLLVTLLLGVAIGYAAFAVRCGSKRRGSIRVYTRGGPCVCTLAGSGAKGFADGARAAAQFKWPSALSPLPDGSVVVADSDNHCIRLIAAGGGAVSTLAGNGWEEGFADGPAAAARFHQPCGIVVGADGAIFVADSDNHRVRCIKNGAVTTFAGSGEYGGADGVGAAASFSCPHGLALGPGGVLYVTEFDAHRVRVISLAGAVTTLAGCGEEGFADGACTLATGGGRRTRRASRGSRAASSLRRSSRRSFSPS